MKDTMIGVDLAKNVFQLHATSMAGHVKFRKKLSRGQFFRFMSEQAPGYCKVICLGSKIRHDVGDQATCRWAISLHICIAASRSSR
jgi:hypothetical protein